MVRNSTSENGQFLSQYGNQSNFRNQERTQKLAFPRRYNPVLSNGSLLTVETIKPFVSLIGGTVMQISTVAQVPHTLRITFPVVVGI